MRLLIYSSFSLFFLFSLNIYCSNIDSLINILGPTNLFEENLEIDTLKKFEINDGLEVVYLLKVSDLKKVVYYNKFKNSYKVLLSEVYQKNKEELDPSSSLGNFPDILISDNHISFLKKKGTVLQYFIFSKQNFKIIYFEILDKNYGSYFNYKMINPFLIFVSPPLIETPKSMYCYERPKICESFSKNSFLIEYSTSGEKRYYALINDDQEQILKEHFSRSIMKGKSIPEKIEDKYIFHVSSNYLNYEPQEYKLLEIQKVKMTEDEIKKPIIIFK